MADIKDIISNIEQIYGSNNSLSLLKDFERVIDELDTYVYDSWIDGELVAGPKESRYFVECTFMWPEKLMPDPRGGRRLLPFDCKVRYRKTTIKIPIKIEDPDDFIPGTHKARLIEKPVWLVEIEMPKSLMSDIRTGGVEFEDQDIDLGELDDAYEQDLNQDEYRADDQAQSPEGLSNAQAPAL